MYEIGACGIYLSKTNKSEQNTIFIFYVFVILK